jgi:hypothetical protein
MIGQYPRLRQAHKDMSWNNEIEGMKHWRWTFVSRAWLDYADALALRLGPLILAKATTEGRHRDEHQADHIQLGARGLVAYFLATGQPVPTVDAFLRCEREQMAEAHHYKIKSAQNLTKPHYGLIWNERDTQYRGVTHFLLMNPCLENEQQWAIVGERNVEDTRELSVPGTWLPTPNPVLATVHLRPYVGPAPGPPATFEWCAHGEELGRRCFMCDPFHAELFPPREPRVESKQQRLR